MEIANNTTLTVKIYGHVETPPLSNREDFRQSVIDTILFILKTQDVDVEFIGYQPDGTGKNLGVFKTEYEDCIFASLTVNHDILARLGANDQKQDIIEAFVTAFESRTHRRLEIDSTVEKKGHKQRIIEMVSDWK